MTATPKQVADVQEVLYDLIVDDPMWIDSAGRPLHYSSEREARIGEFLEKAARTLADAATNDHGQPPADTEQAALVARVAELTRERDEAREEAGQQRMFAKTFAWERDNFIRRALDAEAALASAGRPATTDGEDTNGEAVDPDVADAMWHVDATGDTGTSHTLHPRQYVVKCEWCPEVFHAPTKAEAMQRFRAHERERLHTGNAAITAKFAHRRPASQVVAPSATDDGTGEVAAP